MITLTPAWHRSRNRAAGTLTTHRPSAPPWTRTAAKFALCLMAILLFSHVAAMAQNLGNAPVFGRAVQGQQATTVEGTILNAVNWGCNICAILIAPALIGIGIWHAKNGRGSLGWIVSGVGLMMLSGMARMAEGFITQAGAV